MAPTNLACAVGTVVFVAGVNFFVWPQSMWVFRIYPKDSGASDAAAIHAVKEFGLVLFFFAAYALELLACEWASLGSAASLAAFNLATAGRVEPAALATLVAVVVLASLRRNTSSAACREVGTHLWQVYNFAVAAIGFFAAFFCGADTLKAFGAAAGVSATVDLQLRLSALTIGGFALSVALGAANADNKLGGLLAAALAVSAIWAPKNAVSQPVVAGVLALLVYGTFEALKEINGPRLLDFECLMPIHDFFAQVTPPGPSKSRSPSAPPAAEASPKKRTSSKRK
jgi:hypothetical protein